MTDGDELRKAIEEAGVSIVFLSEKIGKSRGRIYAIIRGADCTASEIAGLSEALHLTRERRDHIFLSKSVN